MYIGPDIGQTGSYKIGLVINWLTNQSNDFFLKFLKDIGGKISKYFFSRYSSRKFIFDKNGQKWH